MFEMAQTCNENGAGPDHNNRLKMDTTRKKKTWEAQKHLPQDGDTRAGTDEPAKRAH